MKIEEKKKRKKKPTIFLRPINIQLVRIKKKNFELNRFDGRTLHFNTINYYVKICYSRSTT